MSKASKARKELKILVDEFWNGRLEQDPEFALILQPDAPWRLDSRSFEAHKERLEFASSCKNKFLKFQSSKIAKHLSASDVLALKAVILQLEDYERCWPLHTFLAPINVLEGPHTDLPTLFGYLQVKTDDDAKKYAKLLSSVPAQVYDQIELMKLGIETKRVPAKVSVQGVAEQINTMLSSEPPLFLKPVIAAHKDSLISSESLDECRAAFQAHVVPAFNKLSAFVSVEYIPACRDDIACSTGQPQGELVYKESLRYHTSTNMTPQEIHDLGLSEVKRISEEMESVAKTEGFENSRAYAEHLRTSSEFVPESEEDHLKKYRSLCMELLPELGKLFKTLPRTPFGVVPTPPHQADHAPAAYYLGPSGDGSRPGTFYVNCSKLESRKTYEMDSLACHEAVPGHHLQTALCQENENLFEFQRFFEDRRYFECPCRYPMNTAYIEGWGLYSEDLGKELGRYTTNAALYGKLSMEMWRACRLVVDTGMHALGWSLEQSVKYMMDNTALSEPNARAEIVRYITWPGQACAYKIGEIKLKQLITKARKALGEKFDVREYHDKVLGCGSVSLEVLADVVDEHIQSVLASEQEK